jgi:hypothetical protein
MTIRKSFFGSVALSVFFGCAAGGTLAIDHAVPRDAVAQDIDEGYFYANLAPHGQWFFQADFGWVWHPARVSAGWRPYTEGQWVWADDVGWTWASQEPWGWATYHYGRWYFDPSYGWSWVPGRTWAPAWVSWRVEAGFIGWAPLWPAYFDRHPEYRWDRWSHDHDWDRRHNGRDWDRWVFTRDRDFTSDRVGRHAISDRRERDRIFSQSRDVTKFDESRPERIGHSIDRAMVEKATGRPVRSVKIEAADKPDAAVDTRSERIRMFRPAVKEAAGKTPDRLGFAKEPSREARETDTIRQEKQRLDKVPEADKARSKSAREPVAREKNDERGGGASVAEPEKKARPAERERAEKAEPTQRERAEKTEPVQRERAEKAEPAQRERAEKAEPVQRERAEKAEPASRERAEKPQPAQRERTEKAEPAQRERTQEAQPAKRAQPERAERALAPPPQRMDSNQARPQREPAQQKPRAQGPQPAQQEQPAPQERARPDEKKKQSGSDQPDSQESKGGGPGNGKK